MDLLWVLLPGFETTSHGLGKRLKIQMLKRILGSYIRRCSLGLIAFLSY